LSVSSWHIDGVNVGLVWGLTLLSIQVLCCSVAVSCPLCQDGVVNADRRLLLQAGHHGYKEEELEFEWQLYFIADGSTSVGTFLSYHSQITGCL